ncbi:MACPF domain-containing protein 4 [Plakobranchus ocellatus]|uniref:MACPF domain-containing protein 4 n=1 Tax=Plakobranchus ocellatus TaxID=259542 RepID=A0AAV3ZHK1_9GAST|nr:MACPF domain-containing protein 4 [Plakobranchus ocellatus]
MLLPLQFSKMSWFLQWSACLLMAVVLSVSQPSHAFLSDETSLSPTPFELTYTPAHVVKHLTRDINVLCSHQNGNQSQLQEVSRIRILMKTSSGWRLLAEQRDNEDEPQSTFNVSMSGKISKDIREVFLQVTWSVATEETFGTYRCDVIGFEWKTHGSVTEVTSEVAIRKGEVTIDDMMDVFKYTSEELARVEAATDKLKDNMDTFNKNFKSLGERIDFQNSKADLLGKKVNSTSEAVDSVTETVTNLTNILTTVTGETTAIHSQLGSVTSQLTSLTKDVNELKSSKNPFEQLLTWPEGQFALLQPKTGCPVDLTFFGGNDRYFRFHTEASYNGDSYTNINSDLSVLPPGTVSKKDSRNIFTFKFCESSGVFNNGSWPSGSYCINKLDAVACPQGFDAASMHLTPERSSTLTDFTSRVVTGTSNLGFCCTKSGLYQTPITLPTHSPFMLYRKGGQCQVVEGMDVSSVVLSIDTENENYYNSDSKDANGPDIDISSGYPIKLYLCHYTSS